MTCEFQSLYFGDEGYVVRCKQCGHYQVAFMSIILTLTENDFIAFCSIVKSKSVEMDEVMPEHCKCVVIRTPAEGICFLLTRNEASRFSVMLEEADTEAKTLSLIKLFNPLK